MKKKDLDKFKSIELHKLAIVHDYFTMEETNISELARKYGPYSTVRRFIMDEKKKRKAEDFDEEDHVNVADFPFLRVGYTYQWADGLKIWLVRGRAIKESEEVFVLVPTKKKGLKHFICTEETE